MSMRTRKIYLIVDIKTDKIIHQTVDQFESQKIFGVLKKAGANVEARCSYQ